MARCQVSDRADVTAGHGVITASCAHGVITVITVSREPAAAAGMSSEAARTEEGIVMRACTANRPAVASDLYGRPLTMFIYRGIIVDAAAVVTGLLESSWSRFRFVVVSRRIWS